MQASTRLTPRELKAKIEMSLKAELRHQADFITLLAEIDSRRLWADWGFPSCFAYLVEGLGLSKGAAFRRLSVARLAQKQPHVANVLQRRELNLATLATVAKYIKDHKLNNQAIRDLLKRAKGLNEDSLERLLARPIRKKNLEEAKPVIVALPLDQAPASKPSPAPNSQRNPVPPLKPGNQTPNPQDATSPPHAEIKAVRMVQVKITVTEEEYDLLLRMRDLNGSAQNGAMTKAIVKAVDHYVKTKDPRRRKPSKTKTKASSTTETKQAKTETKPTSRYIPKAVESIVWKRDQGQCTYKSPSGRRCSAKSNLEVDHITPYSVGGRSDDPENLRLRCKAHNLLAAEGWFGIKFMESFRKSP